jgi:hypothetical protein
MAPRTKALKIGEIPEQDRILVMRADMINLGGQDHLSLRLAVDTEGILIQDLHPIAAPAHRAIPPTNGVVGASLFLDEGMMGTATRTHEDRTTRRRTEMQGSRGTHGDSILAAFLAISVRNASACA